MEITRKIDNILKSHYNSSNKPILLTGARQTGKTYSIRHFGKSNFKSFIEINFFENLQAVEIFKNFSDSENLLLRLSTLTGKKLLKGKTLIFFDEVQVCPEIITAIKFLVDEGSFNYILSGSLLGIELYDIKSLPVGYMDIFEMYPLDFEEFIDAVGLPQAVKNVLENCLNTLEPVDEVIHNKLLELFRLYLIVGGMPACVNKYLEKNNLHDVFLEQQSIIKLYKKDIAQYDPKNKLYLTEIFDLIPSELNSKNKRFILKNLNEHFKFSRYEHSFIWLKDAGVALPAFCCQEPTYPLLLSKATNLFKLFLSDVGLLAGMYANGIQLKLLNQELNINFGSIYENAIAQELKAKDFNLYYFVNKKIGEVDFIIEHQDSILPIEVKSGKAYSKHSALNNLLNSPQYKIKKAIVFSNENIKIKDNIHYLPIYMIMFLRPKSLAKNLIYKVDLQF